MADIGASDALPLGQKARSALDQGERIAAAGSEEHRIEMPSRPDELLKEPK
jgi:hypothetical protein